jgi:hypothetical protein
MSNPFANKNLPLLEQQNSAYLQEEDRLRLREYERSFAADVSRSTVWELLEGLDVIRMFSVIVPPNMIIAGELKGDLKTRMRELRKLGQAYDPMKRSQWVVAKTSTKNLVFVRRTSQGFEFRKALEKCMTMYDPRLTEEITKSVMTKVATIPSPKHCLGRLLKSYPKKGVSAPTPIPHTRIHNYVEIAGLSIDTILDHGGTLKPYLFTGDPIEGKQVTMNLKASGGLPFGGTLKDEAVLAATLELAHTMHEELKRYIAGAPKKKVINGDARSMFVLEIKVPDMEYILKQMRLMVQKRPELFAIIFKAKADITSIEKCVDQNRVICNMPAWIRVLISTAAQAMTDVGGRNILTDKSKRSRSFKGVRMMGDEISVALNKVGLCSKEMLRLTKQQVYPMLELSDNIEVHAVKGSYDYGIMGDDSIVFARVGNYIINLELDVTNMDLSQHAALTLEVHRGIYEALCVSDPVAGALWITMMREKVVIIEGGHTVAMPHGATSGISMIDINNGAVMAAFIERTMEDLLRDIYDEANTAGMPHENIQKDLIEAMIRRRVSTVSESFGMRVKIDGLYITDFEGTKFEHPELIGFTSGDRDTRASLRGPRDFARAAALRREETGKSFVFLGYELCDPRPFEDILPDEGPNEAFEPVWVGHHDMARLIGGISYKKKAFITQERLAAVETARLAATFLAVGRGNNRFYKTVIAPMKERVIGMLEEQVSLGFGAIEDNEGQYLVAVGPDQVKTIEGLLKFFKEGKFETLWSIPVLNRPYHSNIYTMARLITYRGSDTSIHKVGGYDGDGAILGTRLQAEVEIPTLTHMVKVQLGRDAAREGYVAVKSADREPAAAPLTKKNFGSQPPIRIKLWWIKLRPVIGSMHEDTMLGPKKGPIMPLKDWKKQFKADGTDAAYSDDDEDVPPPIRKSWADYSDSDDSDDEAKQEREYRDELERDPEEDDDWAEDNNARAKAGYG